MTKWLAVTFVSIIALYYGEATSAQQKRVAENLLDAPLFAQLDRPGPEPLRPSPEAADRVQEIPGVTPKPEEETITTPFIPPPPPADLNTEASLEPSFLVASAEIIIDGEDGDWTLVAPVFEEASDAPSGSVGISGTKIEALHIATDEDFLYLLLRLRNGEPDENYNTLYFFVANQMPFGDAPGNREAVAAFAQGSWEVWTGVRGLDGTHVQAPTRHNPDFVSSGPDFVEWRVPLQDMGVLNGKYVRAYIHVFGADFDQVTDDRPGGVQLIFE